MLLFAFLVLVPLVLPSVIVPVTNHWSGGFQGEACFTITEEMHTWKIHLFFDQPITSLEVWTADIESVSEDRTEYVLHNKEWNQDEHVGDNLCVNFLGHGTGDINPVITASLEGADSGGNLVTNGPLTTLTLAPGVSTVSTNTVLHTTRTTAAPVSGTKQPFLVLYESPGLLIINSYDLGRCGKLLLQCGSYWKLLQLAFYLKERVRRKKDPVSGDGITSVMTVKNDWQNRFEGWLDFDITETILGWVLIITFSKPVTSMNVRQSVVYSHSADGTEWILINNDDYLYMLPGSHINLRFEATIGDNSGAPEATALLINMGHERNWTVDPLPNTAGSKYNYDDVLMKSILFYEAQRSGALPDNNRIPYRGDSALSDQGDNGEDLSGGWYDAGDYVKFNFPMSWATTMLTWGLLRYKDAYQAAGQLDWMYECIKWPLDYLMKCHVSDNELYVQVGNPGVDHGSWGRPEEMTMERPAYKIDASRPGCDVAMETVAAFAAGYLAFEEKDHAYASRLLAHARSLWQFAITHKGKYSDSVSAANGFYSSFNYTDELCWGSLWMYKATNESRYLTEAQKYYDPTPDWGMSWDDVIIGCQVLMYELTGEENYKQDVQGTFTSWFPGGTIPYSPKGLAYRLQWGSLRYASNMAAMALMAADDGIDTEEYRHWAMCQIHYALGDTGRSFVVGYGVNPPLQPHHRASSCPLVPAPCNMNVLAKDIPNVHVLYGALVGGPDGSDSYTDSRNNYVNNEVATDYNAGFQTAVAALRSLWIRHVHPEQTGNAVCPYT